MAKSQKDAIKKELLDRATGKGKEPSWEGMPTQLQLVKALNFYSATVEPEQLKKCAVTWAKQNCPDKAEMVNAQADWKFGTYGALMRIENRGMKISKLHQTEIRAFVDGLTMPDEPYIKQPKRKKKPMSSSENVNYRNFCDALDGACAAADFTQPTLTVDKEHSAVPVIDACERELESMKEDSEIYPQHMSKWFRAVIKIMSKGLASEASNEPTKTVKKAAKPVATPTVEKAAPKVKPAPKPKAAPKEEPVSDHPLNGKSVAYLFDTRYGRLTRMVTSNTSGFSVKGKTIGGIDEKKSKVALLKDYGSAFKGELAVEDLDGWMSKCVKKGNPIKVGGRLSDAILVVNAA